MSSYKAKTEKYGFASDKETQRIHLNTKASLTVEKNSHFSNELWKTYYLLILLLSSLKKDVFLQFPGQTSHTLLHWQGMAPLTIHTERQIPALNFPAQLSSFMLHYFGNAKKNPKIETFLTWTV